MELLADNDSNVDILDYAYARSFGEIHIKLDAASQLRAIIAVHSLIRGPAIGGCRCLEYPSSQAAIYDALRLARAMSYKAALADLAYGGGKAVLIKPARINDRRLYFHKFAEFINTLDGRYITAEDSGTTMQDMDIIATKTRHVAGVSSGNGDPSPYTAIGVKQGIAAAVHFKLQRNNLQNSHIAIQGVGKVGYYLARELYQAGAKLSVADVNPQATQRCVDEFQAQVVPPETIHKVDCDVFAPCALGAILNEQTIGEINAPVVAGSANNQLARSALGKLLYQRNILYAPDYLINAGGLIYVAGKYDHTPLEQSQQKIDNIYHALLAIFQRSQREQKPSSEIADIMAAEKLTEAAASV